VISDAPLVIIGYGNRDRGDDAAGLLVAGRLTGILPTKVTIRQISGDGTALLEAWRGFETAIIVDAMLSGAEAGTVRRFDVQEVIEGQRFRLSSSHALGLEEAVKLAAALGKLPPRLIVFGIEGQNFSAGAPVSEQVLASIERAARRIVELQSQTS
jgi:hydrogenase maturation protease